MSDSLSDERVRASMALAVYALLSDTRTTAPRQGDCFSLVCTRCDSGMGVSTAEQAASEGWTGVRRAVPSCPMATYVGLCPECRELGGDW